MYVAASLSLSVGPFGFEFYKAATHPPPIEPIATFIPIATFVRQFVERGQIKYPPCARK